MADLVDPDNEDTLPIPLAGARTAPGKIPARTSIRDWSEDDNDDCELLEVLNPQPLAFAYPLPSTSVDLDGQTSNMEPVAAGGRGTTRKRAGGSTSDAGAAAPAPRQRRNGKDYRRCPAKFPVIRDARSRPPQG